MVLFEILVLQQETAVYVLVFSDLLEDLI